MDEGADLARHRCVFPRSSLATFLPYRSTRRTFTASFAPAPRIPPTRRIVPDQKLRCVHTLYSVLPCTRIVVRCESKALYRKETAPRAQVSLNRENDRYEYQRGSQTVCSSTWRNEAECVYTDTEDHRRTIMNARGGGARGAGEAR